MWRVTADADRYRWFWAALRWTIAVPVYFSFWVLLLLLISLLARVTGTPPLFGGFDLAGFDPVNILLFFTASGAVFCVGRMDRLRVALAMMLTLPCAGTWLATSSVASDLAVIANGGPGVAVRIRDLLQLALFALPTTCTIWCGVRLLGSSPNAPEIASLFDDYVSKHRQTYRIQKWTAVYWFALAFLALCTLYLLLNALVFAVAVHILELPQADLVDMMQTGDTSQLDQTAMSWLALLTFILCLVYAALALSVVRYFAARSRRSATAVLQQSRYRPIVLLRSFKDENSQVRPTAWIKSIFGIRYRLEELVVKQVKSFGPPVAIGLPNETVPPLGALRDYYNDDAWQTAVTLWCARAESIVVIAGTSPGSVWELRHIAEQRLLPKLIVVFPPDLGPITKSARLAALAGAASGTAWHAHLMSLESSDLLVARFRSDGAIFVIRGSDKAQATYDLALKATFVDKAGEN
ncbi:MAG: hypothetical protein K2Y05_12670 [Hyphomicrobiaceae bacterium]|nr:hypothetical protein [Hyphomicrobiaceae bacterium]